MSSGDSSLGAWAAQVTNRSQGSGSPRTTRPQGVYFCVPRTRGPCHLVSFCQGPVSRVSLCPEACATVCPPFIAPDTDLLAGSVLSPQSPCTRPSPRLVAGHQPLARAEGQPIQGINPCTSRSDPSVQAGLLGCWGVCGMGSQPWLDAGVPRPRGWPRGPRAGQP